MKPVIDPGLLEQLNAPVKRKPVEDPATLQSLNAPVLNESGFPEAPKNTRAAQELPELFDSGLLQGESPATIAKIAALSAVTPNEQELGQIITSLVPHIGIQNDPGGNVLLANNKTGARAIINRPGISKTDLANFAGLAATFAPTGAAKSLAVKELGKFGAKVGATQAGIEAAQTAGGGDFDKSSIATTAALAPLSQVAFDKAIVPGFNKAMQKSFKKLFGQADDSVVNAAKQIDTNLSVSQATGSRVAGAVEAISKNFPGGGKLANLSAKQQKDIGDVVSRVTNNLSKSADSTKAGTTIQKGIKGFTQRFREQSNTLYGKLGLFIDGNTAVTINNTNDVLERLVTEAPVKSLQNPKLSQFANDIKALSQKNGSIPFDTLTRLRSQVGKLINTNELITGIDRSQLKQIYAGISDDLKLAAQANGPKSTQAFNRANAYYKAGSSRIDGFLQRISNKADPDRIVRELMTSGTEGATKIRAVKRSLTRDEWGVVQSAALKRMGRAVNSSQDDIGELFSTETFLTNLNKLSKPARNELLGSGKAGQFVKDLEAVAKVASAIRDGSSVLKNPSGTSANLLTGAASATAVLGVFYQPLLSWGVGATVLSNRAIASLMTSPAFVSWLSSTPKMAGQNFSRSMGRLMAVHQGADPETQEAIAEYIEALNPINAAN